MDAPTLTFATPTLISSGRDAKATWQVQEVSRAVAVAGDTAVAMMPVWTLVWTWMSREREGGGEMASGRKEWLRRTQRQPWLILSWCMWMIWMGEAVRRRHPNVASRTAKQDPSSQTKQKVEQEIRSREMWRKVERRGYKYKKNHSRLQLHLLPLLPPCWHQRKWLSGLTKPCCQCLQMMMQHTRMERRRGAPGSGERSDLCWPSTWNNTQMTNGEIHVTLINNRTPTCPYICGHLNCFSLSY